MTCYIHSEYKLLEKASVKILIFKSSMLMACKDHFLLGNIDDLPPDNSFILVNPIALRKAKIVYNFGLSECNRVNI